MGVQKKVGWSVAVLVAALGVGSLSTYAIATNAAGSKLTHSPAATLESPARELPVAAGQATDATELKTKLTELAADKRLGTFSGQVADAETGQIIWEKDSTKASRPASVTKILTATAALKQLSPDDRIETQVVRGASPGEVVIKSAGDVWLTNEKIVELAQQIGTADKVLIDTSAWSSATFLDSWGAENIGEGYIAPMEPSMLYGGRIGAKSGDVPRSHTPALDVAKALAAQLGAQSGPGNAPEGAEVVARVQSPPLSERLDAMMEDSDNVMAEAIGREVALARGTGNGVADAVRATKDVLAELGIDLTGLDLKDNSGLSETNLNTPQLLNSVLLKAVQDKQLRPLLDALPVAGGNGTLATRYQGLDSRGWVRAKTGTLTNTSALAGYVTTKQGHSYTFALLSGDSDINSARAALDDFATGIHGIY